MIDSAFFKFVFGFAAIIAVAFGILYVANSQTPKPIDTVAHP